MIQDKKKIFLNYKINGDTIKRHFCYNRCLNCYKLYALCVKILQIENIEINLAHIKV